MNKSKSGRGYFKHSGIIPCPICGYYKLKERLTGKDYNLDNRQEG